MILQIKTPNIFSLKVKKLDEEVIDVGSEFQFLHVTFNFVREHRSLVCFYWFELSFRG